MKILSAAQIRRWDAHTIATEPIASHDLMERASRVFTDWFTSHYPERTRPICLFCGPGNNGGDGLVIARLLHQRGYRPSVYLAEVSPQTSPDHQHNRERLAALHTVPFQALPPGAPLPDLPDDAILIDALFGSGLSRPIEGYWAQHVEHLNQRPCPIVAVDIPSGLHADRNSTGTIVRAQRTLSFERPKRAFFFPQNAAYLGQWAYRPIQLTTDFPATVPSPYHFVDQPFIKRLLKQRRKFDHKGTYGHALLIAGSYGKVGAAILAARAALRSGTGLVTIHAPRCAYEILQMSVPEAMGSVERHERVFSGVQPAERMGAWGIGCGLGTNDITFTALAELLVNSHRSVVLDADALNIIAQHPALLSTIPARSILTPHPKEFERLFGKSANDFERQALQGRRAQELGVYILLKGAHSCLATPEGTFYFNSTGNPGMATAGSGDVLTGIITGLLAQGYASQEAALLGMYLHGLAGDLAVAERWGPEALIASDIIDQLGAAFNHLKR